MKLFKGKSQHILVDRGVLRRITRYAELSAEDTVLEVGCGTGNLTAYLLRKAGKVIGIEIDSRMVELLKRKFSGFIEGGRFEIIHADALRIDFPRFDKFVSNIPYKISSPLTFKLLKSRFQIAVVMYQMEFARRLVARPGSKDYGRLSVVARSYCRAEIVESVPRWAFIPRPKVNSAIVKIYPEPELKVENRELFEDFVTFLFSRRRKKLGKSVEEFCKLKGVTIDLPDRLRDLRPEQVSPETFAELSDSAVI
jgi:16S rRNA (adenine1518-N6/adenine1519-N6)-dimethyltransferase